MTILYYCNNYECKKYLNSVPLEIEFIRTAADLLKEIPSPCCYHCGNDLQEDPLSV